MADRTNSQNSNNDSSLGKRNLSIFFGTMIRRAFQLALNELQFDTHCTNACSFDIKAEICLSEEKIIFELDKLQIFTNEKNLNFEVNKIDKQSTKYLLIKVNGLKIDISDQLFFGFKLGFRINGEKKIIEVPLSDQQFFVTLDAQTDWQKQKQNPTISICRDTSCTEEGIPNTSNDSYYKIEEKCSSECDVQKPLNILTKHSVISANIETTDYASSETKAASTTNNSVSENFVDAHVQKKDKFIDGELSNGNGAPSPRMQTVPSLKNELKPCDISTNLKIGNQASEKMETVTADDGKNVLNKASSETAMNGFVPNAITTSVSGSANKITSEIESSTTETGTKCSNDLHVTTVTEFANTSNSPAGQHESIDSAPIPAIPEVSETKPKTESSVGNGHSFTSKRVLEGVYAAQKSLDSVPIELKPARNGEPYSAEIRLNGLWDLVVSHEGEYSFEQNGLKVIAKHSSNNTVVEISGMPSFGKLKKPAVLEFRVAINQALTSPKNSVWACIKKFGESVFGASSEIEKTYLRDKFFKILINPNPDDLWETLEPKSSIFAKATSDYRFVPAPNNNSFRIVAASQRGRSHAHEGTHRDDDFNIEHIQNSDWYALIVADGAGSAKYSREGSRLACQVGMERCREMLSDERLLRDLDKRVGEAYKAAIQGTPYPHLQDLATDILGSVARKAKEAIQSTAAAEEGKGCPEKYFATTFLAAIVKKYDFATVILTFWIGDGAIAAIRSEKGNNASYLLGMPDEGEFGGQTKFLTMSDVCSKDEEVRPRIKICFCPNEKPLKYLFLMTDGVSDPKFETTANLQKTEKWNDLIKDLESVLDAKDDIKAQLLLDWLGFKSPGNHDDRTIAILY